MPLKISGPSLQGNLFRLSSFGAALRYAGPESTRVQPEETEEKRPRGVDLYQCEGTDPPSEISMLEKTLSGRLLRGKHGLKSHPQPRADHGIESVVLPKDFRKRVEIFLHTQSPDMILSPLGSFAPIDQPPPNSPADPVFQPPQWPEEAELTWAPISHKVLF